MELNTSIDLDYSYAQQNLGGDVNAVTLYNQKYEIKYATTLTTAYDFLGAVRVELQDAWYTDQAATSKVAPTLELQAKGSQAAASLIFEEVISTTDLYRETSEVTNYSTSLSFNLDLTPVLWPEVKLKYQRLGDFQDSARESTTNTLEFSTRKDIYAVRLEFNYRRNQIDTAMPARTGSVENTWSAKATYKERLWGGTDFELAYEVNETYKDEQTRGVFTGETSSYNQILRTRLKNSLVLLPRLTLGLTWEYQFEQDLLALDFDYKLRNKYVLDLRWDAFNWLKITSEARRETELVAALEGEDDERALTDSLRGGFDFTAIPWLRLTGKAELTKGAKIVANTGGSVDKLDVEKYELIAKNTFGDFWDFTGNASTSNTHTDDFHTNRETKVKAELKLRLLGLGVTSGYEVSRKTEWDRRFDFPTDQQQVRDGKIRFEYQMQLADMIKATFSHQYGIKVDDTLDEVLNFDRVLQFNESTRLSVLLTEFFRDMRLEGQVERKASDTEGDPDPQLVELSYSLRLDWKIDRLTLLSSIKYNDKGSSFDDVSFNAKATWKGERLEISGEYQFDKIIKDDTEPKDEKRKLNLRLSYIY